MSEQTLEDVRSEATRLSAEFFAGRPDREEWRHFSTSPDRFDQPHSTSEHPVAWIAMYSPIPPDDTVIDGGELFLRIDLESGTVNPVDWWGRIYASRPAEPPSA